MDPIVGGLITSAGSAVMSGLGNFFGGNAAYNRSKKLMDRQAAYSREFATTAFDRQRQLIQEQNAYNDPMASRARLENAGYNPFLTNLDGSGQQMQMGSSPMAAVPDAPYQAAAYGSNLGSDMVQGFQGVMDALTKSRVGEAQARNQSAEARTKEMANDTTGPNGQPLSLSQFYLQVNQARGAAAIADEQELNNAMLKIKNDLLLTTYHDENGNTVPAAEFGEGISDADGNYTYFGYMQKTKALESVGKMREIFANVTNIQSQEKLNLANSDYVAKMQAKVEQEINNMKELLPYQKQVYIATARELISRIAVNNTQANLNIANTALTNEKTITERDTRGVTIDNIKADTNNKNANTKTVNDLRPHHVKQAKNDAIASVYEANRSRYGYQTEKWRYGINYKSPWGIFWNGTLQPISSVLGPAAVVGSKFVK